MDHPASSITTWTGSQEQKLWGLMQIWAEVRFNFAFFDRIPGLDWDAEVQKRIPVVLEAHDLVAYYRVLQELVSLLNDGHTVVMFSRDFRAGLDSPPLELEMVQNKILITRVGKSDETERANLHPGLEVVKINGCPAGEYLQENVMRFYQGGTKHWGEAFGLFNLLQGPKDSLVNLLLERSDGGAFQVELKRNSGTSGGTTFKQRIVDYDPLLEKRMFDRIVYFRLSTFDDPRIVDKFNEELDKLDLKFLGGMILDVRDNIGGESGIAFDILARLTEKPLEASKWTTRKYLPAFRAWGSQEEWFESQMSPVQPCPGTHYLGPLIILTGNRTFSSAEDFLVPLIHSRRATLIGEKTAGSTGQPLRVILPGEGYCLICTLRSTFPDGREFVGLGIEPDITVPLTRQDVYADRDPVLEKALDVLLHPGG